MSNKQSAYFITIGESNTDGVMADTFEETLIYVGRLIERLHTDDNFRGKYIYVHEYINDNGKYIKQNNLFHGTYLIEE